MEKNILISNGNQPFNQLIADFLIENGHRVHLLFDDEEAELTYFEKIASHNQHLYKGFVVNKMREENLQQVLDRMIEHSGSIDVFIHGNEMVDEEELLLDDMNQFETYITDQFKKIFLLTKLVSSMMIKKKQGSIIFPIVYDALYFAGYPSSPVLNHGKISMMKCLSRELSAFRLTVNVMTFGYYHNNFGKEEKKEVLKKLGIYSLKPQLLELNQLISALNLLINPPSTAISGQDIHIGTGIETGL